MVSTIRRYECHNLVSNFCQFKVGWRRGSFRDTVDHDESTCSMPSCFAGAAPLPKKPSGVIEFVVSPLTEPGGSAELDDIAGHTCMHLPHGAA